MQGNLLVGGKEIYCFVLVLEIELKASHLQGKHCAPELHSQPKVAICYEQGDTLVISKVTLSGAG